jgi:DNA-binding beta-propeller fold protein YncE
MAPSDWNWRNVCKPEGQDSATAAKPEGAVIVVDVARAKLASAHAVGSRVPAACDPVRIATSPFGDRIYVSARGSNAVLAFDASKLINDPDRARLGMASVGNAPVPGCRRRSRKVSNRGEVEFVTPISHRADARCAQCPSVSCLHAYRCRRLP